MTRERRVPRVPYSPRRLQALLLAVVAVLVAPSGCGPAGGAQTKITNRRADASAQWSDDLFSFALANLNHLEDNDCEEMLRATQQRLAVLQQSQIAPGLLPANSLLASWPEPDMLRQVVSRLNQWVDTQEKPAAAKPDPLLATLPAALGKLPMVEDLGQAHFTSYDGYMLMEAVWLRDASRSKWASGGTADELQVARSLFDWTVRNIQTDSDSPDRAPQVPWETLFLGHGTTWERAWTYILLLRQRGIDAAVLALPGEGPEPGPLAAETGGTPKGKDSLATPAGQPPVAAAEKQSLTPWCVGVLIGDTRNEKAEKALYLFDFNLGLPIPAADGIAADQAGRLDVQPATLEQVAANPKLLDRLGVGAGAPYWARKADLKRVAALIEASPLYLSPRARRIGARLTGEQKLVLNTEPSQQATGFKAAGVGEVRLWELPYTTLQRRLALSPDAIVQRLLAYVPFMSSPAAPLYKGRIMHLKGRFFDEKEAIAYYQKARPRNQTVAEDVPRFARACFESFAQQRKARGDELTPAEEQELKQEAAWQAQQLARAIIEGKLAASYWLGLIQYDLGEFNAALDYFRVRTLQFGPRVFWAPGAYYNIARTWEASGQRQKAIDVYILLHNDPGNLLRARWLAELDGGKNKKAEEKKTEEKKLDVKKADGKKSEAGKGK
jgi:tetratricopeptide (TPR) repeat protein